MFERFTKRARRAVVLAQEEARMLKHDHIGTDHLLLGLLHEGDGIAARALETSGVHIEAVRAFAAEASGSGDKSPSHLPFTPAMKHALELSGREAHQLGGGHIGTEHLLLGLIREGESAGVKALVHLGASLNKLRATVLDLINREPGESEGAMTMRFESSRLSFRDPPPRHEEMPVCPGCRATMIGNLGSRTLEIGGAPGRRLFVAYCTVCGVAIETRFEERSE